MAVFEETILPADLPRVEGRSCFGFIPAPFDILVVVVVVVVVVVILVVVAVTRGGITAPPG